MSTTLTILCFVCKAVMGRCRVTGRRDFFMCPKCARTVDDPDGTAEDHPDAEGKIYRDFKGSR